MYFTLANIMKYIHGNSSHIFEEYKYINYSKRMPCC